MSIKLTSFEELSIELVQQLDGSSKVSIKEERRLDIETTSSAIANIMPCSYPNPEQILMAAEESLERAWETNLNIDEDKKAYVRRMLKYSYS